MLLVPESSTFYMQRGKSDDSDIMVALRPGTSAWPKRAESSNGLQQIPMQLSDLYNLFNLDASDLTLLRCFTLYVAWKFNLLLTNHSLSKCAFRLTSSLPCICLLTLYFFTNRNMTVEVEKTRAAVGFLDPECLCSTMLNSTKNTLAFSVSYMWNAFELYAKKNFMLTAYLSTNRWIVVVIILKQRKVYYLDSLKTIKTNTNPFEQIINE
jgi:hypothetical protein